MFTVETSNIAQAVETSKTLDAQLHSGLMTHLRRKVDISTYGMMIIHLQEKSWRLMYVMNSLFPSLGLYKQLTLYLMAISIRYR